MSRPARADAQLPKPREDGNPPSLVPARGDPERKDERADDELARDDLVHEMPEAARANAPGPVEQHADDSA
jgi:hypothetical protein